MHIASGGFLLMHRLPAIWFRHRELAENVPEE
jgi:hypothetical protein